ncbi:polysaccharide pyruvyl transferase family protein [Rothia sp. P7181]|uniref:polysaccharide pyruvyl transferase family protein n=1 Tax=Rothia sp. P7181 TaxID=3402663 RepID=UPI003AED7358
MKKILQQIPGFSTPKNTTEEHRHENTATTHQPEEAPIYLISMAGYPNYGDELITRRWLEFFAEHKPNTEIWLDVREPGTASALFKNIHPNLHVVNTVFRAIFEYEHNLNRHPSELIKTLGSPRFDAGLLQLRRAGTIHLLGGGFINSVWPSNALIIETMQATAQETGARLIATGQGLMPRITENFTGFSHISVRDTPSSYALGITRGLDDAYLINPNTLPQNTAEFSPENTRLYLCVQNDAVEDGQHQRMLNFVRAQVKKLDIPRDNIHYVEAIPGADYAGYEALQDIVNPHGFISFQQFWDEDFTFSPEQLWITSRFHHHLMASLAGARGIALSGKPDYYDVKHQSLLELGSHWKLSNADSQELYDWDDLTAPEDMTQYVHTKYAQAQQLYNVTNT